MKTDELREKYLAFFQSKGHVRKPSDVLVPTWDPSVLFTPAGMNQFKDHFLGKVKLEFTRATSCQKCLRTGDIDNVGRTAYHHTFFEMLGNFSFGDYFKREAINWAWEFLTKKEWLGLDPGRLSVTVYLDDDEAAGIWQKDIGLAPERIERMGEDDNFWPAGAPTNGPNGVCGPCSEIYFHPPQGKSVEIWNLVFTQFNRMGNPPNNLRPLPSKNIDTGMGLERCAAVLQGVDTNYHIDTLRPIVEAAAEVCGTKYDPASDSGRRLRRITDHVRACTFAIHENVYPGPNKQKYVVRRLLRRAVLDGHQLGLRDAFLYNLVPMVAQMMRVAYPELSETVERVASVIKQEENSFFGTIDRGLARIEKIFTDMEKEKRSVVEGKVAFELYSTYGFPPELFESMAAERNFAFDWDGFKTLIGTPTEPPSGPVDVFAPKPTDAIKKAMHSTEFLGYDKTEATAEVKFILAQDHLCNHLTEVGHEKPVTLVLDRSPFYGEGGGQVGDTGEIVGEGFVFQVTDTKKDGDLLLHLGHLLKGQISAGAKVTARVDSARRNGIRRAHSATHILHYALQKNLGGHAQQQGSKVEDDALRFDFTNLQPVDSEHLAAIEREVIQKIAAKEPVGSKYLPIAEARAAGAMMLFGEKYPETVRMVSMGEFSKELCGGIHLNNTGEVGAFEIVSEEGVSAGTRRITALTGERAKENALKTKLALEQAGQLLGVGLADVAAGVRRLATRVRDLKKQFVSGVKPAGEEAIGTIVVASPLAHISYAQQKSTLKEAARALNVPLFDVPARVTAALAEVEDLKKQIAALSQSGDVSAETLLKQAVEIGGAQVIVAETPGANPNLMRQWIDQLRQRTGPIAVLLAAGQGSDKVTLVAGVSRDLAGRGVSAGNWVRDVAPVVGGGGGGKPDMAQAGGKHPGKLPEALETARQVIRTMLG